MELTAMRPVLLACVYIQLFIHTSSSAKLTDSAYTNVSKPEMHPILAREADAVSAQNQEPTDILDLLDDVRRQQLSLALEQANHSHAGDLAKFEAEAAVAEAEQRRQEAQLKTLKARSVFSSEKSRYNLGYIGRGYDIFMGHPLSPDGAVDPGFRLPMIELPYSWRHTADGEYRIPDNVDVVAEPSAKFVSSSSVISNEQSYRSSVSQSMSISSKVSFGFGMFSASASFSANSAYKRETNELATSQNSYMDTVGRAVVYRARLGQTDRLSKMTPELEQALHRLTPYECSARDKQGLEPYIEILREFGTHFTTSVAMGARAVQRQIISKTTAQKIKTEMRSRGLSVGVDVGIGPVSFGTQFSKKDSSSHSSGKKHSQEKTEMREFYVGGTVPEGKLEYGSSENLRAWARSAQENPAPIQYALASIYELIRTDAYFRTPMKWLSLKRDCMQLALQRYCLEVVPDPTNCVRPEQSSHRRRKRSLNDKPPQYIKYGDFITLNDSSGALLGVDQKVEIVGGQGLCHLMRADKTTGETANHHFFQILPEAGQPQLMGQNLTYGTKFRLSTLKGHELLIVPTFMSDPLPLLGSPDDFYKIRDVGRQLCIAPKATPGRTHYLLWTNLQEFKTDGVNMTLRGDTLTHLELCLTGQVCSLKNHPTSLYGPVNDAGDIEHVVLRGKNVRNVGIVHVTNAVTKVHYVFKCINYKDYRRCDRTQKISDSVLRNLTDQFTAYAAELSFNSKHEEDHTTPVDTTEAGVVRLHSDRPEIVSFWGYQAPDLLAFQNNQPTVETVRIHEEGKCTENDISIYQKGVTYRPGEVRTNEYRYAFNTDERVAGLTVNSPAAVQIPELLVTYTDSLGDNRRSTPVYANGKYRFIIGPAITIEKLNLTYSGEYELKKGDVTLKLCEKAFKNTRYFYGDHMEWIMTPAGISLQTDPVIAVVHQEPLHLLKPAKHAGQGRQVAVVYPSNKVICSNDGLKFRQALGDVLDKPEALFENVTMNVTRTESQTVVTVSFDVTVYHQDTVEPLMGQLKLQLKRKPYSLPCNMPAAQSGARSSRTMTRSNCRGWVIGLMVTCSGLLLLLVCGMFYHYRYQKRHSCKRHYFEGPDPCYGSVRGDYVNPHEYVNAYMGLHRMMSQLARMSQHYENHGCNDGREPDQGEPQSPGEGDYEYPVSRKRMTRMNSRNTEKHQSHGGRSAEGHAGKGFEHGHFASVRLRHPSRRMRKHGVKGNIKRLTRCLSGEEEEIPENQTRLNNTENEPDDPACGKETDLLLSSPVTNFGATSEKCTNVTGITNQSCAQETDAKARKGDGAWKEFMHPETVGLNEPEKTDALLPPRGKKPMVSPRPKRHVLPNTAGSDQEDAVSVPIMIGMFDKDDHKGEPMVTSPVLTQRVRHPTGDKCSQPESSV